jgi:hypothetical protein
MRAFNLNLVKRYVPQITIFHYRGEPGGGVTPWRTGVLDSGGDNP